MPRFVAADALALHSQAVDMLNIMDANQPESRPRILSGIQLAIKIFIHEIMPQHRTEWEPLLLEHAGVKWEQLDWCDHALPSYHTIAIRTCNCNHLLTISRTQLWMMFSVHAIFATSPIGFQGCVLTATSIHCNIGDLLMSWSDDRFKSTFHRVKAPTEPGDYYGERYSIAFKSFRGKMMGAALLGPSSLI